MKAAIVLLSGHSLQNEIRRIAVDLNRIGQVGFYASLLPAHVSLKQPFPFESLDRLDAYFERLAAGTAPFEVVLDRLYYEEAGGYGILGYYVVETERLRSLHNQLNAELRQVVKDPHADYDGSEYRFHLTIELGKVGRENPLKEYYERQAGKVTRKSFMAKEIALFYYSDEAFSSGSFITYKVLPMGVSADSA